jgi:hypothetical protein
LAAFGAGLAAEVSGTALKGLLLMGLIIN